jgi:hypothetical protein
VLLLNDGLRLTAGSFSAHLPRHCFCSSFGHVGLFMPLFPAQALSSSDACRLNDGINRV